MWLLSRETRHRQFALSGNPLNKVLEAPYLGVASADSRVRDRKTLDRNRKAEIAAHQLRPLGITPKGFIVEKAKRIYKCRFSRPVMRAPACVSAFLQFLQGKTTRKGRPGGREGNRGALTFSTQCRVATWIEINRQRDL